MKAKSMTASAKGMPSIRARPVHTASVRPVLSLAAAKRSGYDFRSANSKGSALAIEASVSSKDPGSARSST